MAAVCTRLFQILEEDRIVSCLSAEPYMSGTFVKLTNNARDTDKKREATKYGVAFGHFNLTSSPVIRRSWWICKVRDRSTGLKLRLTLRPSPSPCPTAHQNYRPESDPSPPPLLPKQMMLLFQLLQQFSFYM